MTRHNLSWGVMNMRRLYAGFWTALVLAAVMPFSAAASDEVFGMTTKFLGPEFAADIYNGGAKGNQAHMTRWANTTGQRWHMEADGQYVRLKNDFGDSSLCLDVINGGARNNFVRLAPCGNYSGQKWLYEPVPRTSYYRLTTAFRGKDMCLDVVNGGADDNDLKLAKCGNYTGQMWLLESR